MSEYKNKPVFLDEEKCNGCISCMKRCPTEAIRVRNGKAIINYERCVGCGECVKVCPTHAKKENFDKLSVIDNFKYKIIISPPSLYGQFNNLTDINYVLTGLINLGFDEVYESALGAEIISMATRKYLKEPNTVKPLISSACPAITNLILMRYENLVPHLSPMKLPEAISAENAKKNAILKTGLQPNEIGVFVLAECAAKTAELKSSTNKRFVDGVLSVKEIYFLLLNEMNKLTSVLPLSTSGKLGISWGCSTGEAIGIGTENYLSADGIENIMEVLNELEHDKLNKLDFLELNACPSGCVGGSMNIENPFLARTRLRLLRKSVPFKDTQEIDTENTLRDEPYVTLNILKLDDDRLEALKKTIRMKKIYDKLPKLDCGACGAPRCMAFAEDYVKGMDVKCKYKGDDFNDS